MAKKAKDRFVKVPLWWIAEAAKATGSPVTLVLVRMLYVAWRHRNMTFRLPNGWLETQGVSRFVKYRALRELEAAGLIRVQKQPRKSPIITLTLL